MKPLDTEPAVLPARPDVKPRPQRETQKPKPQRGDPWTVPAPKVNPTPKAKIDSYETQNTNKEK